MKPSEKRGLVSVRHCWPSTSRWNTKALGHFNFWLSLSLSE